MSSGSRINTLAVSSALVFAAVLAGCGKNDTTGAPTTAPTGSGVGSGAPSGPSIASVPPTAAAPPAVEAARSAPPAQPTAGSSATPAGSAAAGQGVFASTCVACHGAGVAGAPKLGDKADWGPRLGQGQEVLYQHAIAGYTGAKGVMPPKGGNPALADADVRSAVDYMVSQAR
jgi:cytochrome c5